MKDSSRKTTLLKGYRRSKRLAMFSLMLVLLGLSAWLSWWLLPLGLLLVWLIHEAAFADHIFYTPKADYLYRFPEDTPSFACKVVADRLLLPSGAQIQEPTKATLILKLRLESTWLGWWFDPSVVIGDDCQTFERGTSGLRYLNLTGQGEALMAVSLRLEGRFCRLATEGKLFVFAPRPIPERTMILAPHADDAELAAFGLYSDSAKEQEVSIITLTQGEIEASEYQKLGLSREEAARLKGRLRTWDSLAIPLWGGVPARHCVQLGYYCMRLKDMQATPDQPFVSLESGDTDIRPVRRQNPFSLPADKDGLPTWNNLVADLAACLRHFKPQRIILPHPRLDPHPDHVATHAALKAALEQLNGEDWQPEEYLLYANHLHDNDLWPMGEAGTGVVLPPAMEELGVDGIYCHLLDKRRQIDKAMALRMQHDLQTTLPMKKRLRRLIQSALLARRWPTLADDEYLRKSVRKHEVFWIRQASE